MGVRRLVVANGPNIFQMLIVFLRKNFVPGLGSPQEELSDPPVSTPVDRACKVVNVTYADRAATCEFCEGAVEKGRDAADSCVDVPYPCVTIGVNFLDGSGRHVGHGVLYDDSVQATDDDQRVVPSAPVSYTHLTLPTIYSV